MDGSVSDASRNRVIDDYKAIAMPGHKRRSSRAAMLCTTLCRNVVPPRCRHILVHCPEKQKGAREAPFVDV